MCPRESNGTLSASIRSDRARTQIPSDFDIFKVVHNINCLCHGLDVPCRDVCVRERPNRFEARTYSAETAASTMLKHRIVKSNAW
jgi:predicted helicase